jgi:hypothetical protein
MWLDFRSGQVNNIYSMITKPKQRSFLPDDDFFKASQVAVKILFVVAQIHDRIQNQLSWSMIGDLPSTFCAYQWVWRLLGIKFKVVRRTALTKSVDRWVL